MSGILCVQKKLIVLLLFMLGVVLGAIYITNYFTSLNYTTKTQATVPKINQKPYIGGNPTTIEQWPFVVMLTWDHKVKKTNGEYDFIRARRCTGSIIDKNWILTAAHCVGNENDSDVGIVVGMDDTVNQVVGSKDNVQYLRPKKVIKHPKYKVKSFKDHGLMAFADIALLYVDKDLSRQPVPVAESVNYNTTNAYGIGWGMYNSTTNTVELPTQLQELKVFPYKQGAEYSALNMTVGTLFSDKVLVTYAEKSQSVGAGDSGGPLVLYNDSTNRYELVGVTSSGSQYTNVVQYRDWINENMGY